MACAPLQDQGAHMHGGNVRGQRFTPILVEVASCLLLGRIVRVLANGEYDNHGNFDNLARMRIE